MERGGEKMVDFSFRRLFISSTFNFVDFSFDRFVTLSTDHVVDQTRVFKIYQI